MDYIQSRSISLHNWFVEDKLSGTCNAMPQSWTCKFNRKWMIKQLLLYKWSNKVTYGSLGSHGAVEQLDDTGVGPGTFVTLNGACGKTTTTNDNSWDKDTKNWAAVTSLRFFLFHDDFSGNKPFNFSYLVISHKLLTILRSTYYFSHAAQFPPCWF